MRALASIFVVALLIGSLFSLGCGTGLDCTDEGGACHTDEDCCGSLLCSKTLQTCGHTGLTVTPND